MSNTLQIGPFTPSFGAVIPISVLQAMSEASQTPIQNTITNVTQIKKDDEVLRTDFTFKNNMRLGSTISDVRKLQDVLKSLGSDIYPEGTVSGYFGPLTYKAVVRFQEKYFDEILAPLGNKKGTGVVGEYTRKKLNSILLK